MVTWAKKTSSFEKITNAYESFYSEFYFFFYTTQIFKSTFLETLKKIQIDTKTAI